MNHKTLSLTAVTALICAALSLAPKAAEEAAKAPGSATDAMERNARLERRLREILVHFKNGTVETVTDFHAVQALIQLRVPPEMGVPAYRDLLRKWLNQPKRPTRAQAEFRAVAIDALIKLGAYGPKAREAVPELLAVTRSSVSNFSLTRGFALAALAKVAPADPQVIGTFAGALSDSDGERSGVLFAALGDAGAAARPALPALRAVLDNEWRESEHGEAYLTLGKILAADSTLSVEDACKRLEHINTLPVDEGAAAFAILQAAGTNAAPAMPAVVDILKTERRTYILYACFQLAAKGGFATKPPVLRELFRYTAYSENLREAATDVIEVAMKSGCTEAIPELAVALRSPNLFQRQAATVAIMNMGGPAKPLVPHLVAALKKSLLHQNYALGDLYAGALSNMHRDGASAAPEIAEMLRPHSPYFQHGVSVEEFRKDALLIFSEIGPPASPVHRKYVLMEAVAGLRTTSAETIFTAARVVAQLPEHTKTTVPLLVAVLKSAEAEGGFAAQKTVLYQARNVYTRTTKTWNWNDATTVLCCAEVLRSLQSLSSLDQVLPLLRKHQSMAATAPLHSLQAQINKLVLSQAGDSLAAGKK